MKFIIYEIYPKDQYRYSEIPFHALRFDPKSDITRLVNGFHILFHERKSFWLVNFGSSCEKVKYTERYRCSRIVVSWSERCFSLPMIKYDSACFQWYLMVLNDHVNNLSTLWHGIKIFIIIYLDFTEKVINLLNYSGHYYLFSNLEYRTMIYIPEINLWFVILSKYLLYLFNSVEIYETDLEDKMNKLENV